MLALVDQVDAFQDLVPLLGGEIKFSLGGLVHDCHFKGGDLGPLEGGCSISIFGLEFLPANHDFLNVVAFDLFHQGEVPLIVS